MDIYVVPYTNGLLLGTLALTGGVPQGNLTWIRPSKESLLFTQGFTNTLAVAQSELWITPPAGTPALVCSAGQLIISNASTNLIFYVAVSTNNTLSKLGSVPTNAGSLSGSINPKTGLLTVSIGHSPGIAAATGYGVVLQNTNSLEGSNSVAGYFTTTTNTGLLLLQTNLSVVAPIIEKTPVSRNFAPGSNVQFSVQAIGSLPLSYQWQLDGTALTNGGRISGATSANLVVLSEEIFDAGSYSVIVSNTSGAITSSPAAILIVPAPIVAITSPKAGFDTTSATLNVTGTAGIKGGGTNNEVAVVVCGVNGGGWTNATQTVTGSWSNWSATVTLTAGWNTVMAYSVDPVGDHSATNSVAVFYTTYSRLDLQTNGYGSIANSAKPNPLVIGSNSVVVGTNYTVKAVPNPGNLFSGWTGTITSNANPLTFTAPSNMTLTANFVTNFFIAAAGSYNGLFYAADSNGAFLISNGVGVKSSGLLKNLLVTTNGAYSASLYIGGSNYSINGNFGLSGAATNQIKRASALGSLTLALALNLTNNPPQVTGTVQGTNGGMWTASLLAELAATHVPPARVRRINPAGEQLSRRVWLPPGHQLF